MKLSNLFKLSVISSALALTGCGSSSDKEEEKVNVLPTVSVANVSANENVQVTLSAVAGDSDGSISSYSWQLTSGQDITLDNTTSDSLTFTAPSVTADGDTLSFKVTVTDNSGDTAEATAEVTLTNVMPSATVAEQTVNEKEAVSITASVDGNGDTIASYLWQQTSGTNVELANSDTDTLSFTAPEVSADEIVGLSLTVTDADGDEVTVESNVNISQLTFPLTIAGLATDSPISNGEISVNVAGREVTIDVTADENGVYSVDLLLDDSETDAFISIVAQGVAEQANAGLITLLGTAGQLSTMAGDDNTLTEDESFAVNVTNITTAQYALAKLANNGEDITSDSELEVLTQALNYDEVITLATAIKVAIDKSANNPDLALPAGTTNTLELVENVEATQAYVQEVIDEPEFEQAQEEIFQDENLIDTSSTWHIPETYFLLPQSTLTSGSILRFNQDNTGTADGSMRFTWQEADGVITAVAQDDGWSGFEDHMINGELVNLEVHYAVTGFEFKRLSSNTTNDVILYTRTQLKRFPSGLLPDETITSSRTVSAIKDNGVININHSGAGVAYLPFSDNNPDVPGVHRLGADEFTLNADGTGHATIMDLDFNWKVENGVFQLILPEEEGTTYLPTWKQLTSNQFAHEFYEGGELNPSDDYVGEGVILPERMSWQASDVAGLYTYDSSVFGDPLEHYFFELHENGDAETISTSDYNEDGVLSEDEYFVMYGKWSIDSEGVLSITRVRHQDYGWTEECRDVATEGCVLYHTRSWRMIGQSGNAISLFHNHDFADGNWTTFDNRTVYKVNSAPVEKPASTNAQPNKGEVSSQSLSKTTKAKTAKAVISEKFSKLEPQL